MRVITTIINQVLVSIVWLVFTHYFLTPKENNWKREIKSYPIWIIWIFLTATVLWYHTTLKTVLVPIILILIFSYIYQFNIKRFILAILAIEAVTMIIEVIALLILTLCLNVRPENISYIDNILLLPFILSFNIVAFNFILKKCNSIGQLPSFTLIFFLSQIPMTLMVELTLHPHDRGSLVVPCLFIAVLGMSFQMLIWRQKDEYFNIKKQKMLNHQLLDIYNLELDAYLEQKDQLLIQRKLRHDLLNEIQIVKYMEQNHMHPQEHSL